MAKYYVMGKFSQKGVNGFLTGDSNRESVVKFNVPKLIFYELPVYILKEGYFNCMKPTSTQSDLSESQIFITGLVTFCLKLGA